MSQRYTRANFTRDFAIDLIKEHGSVSAAALAVQPLCDGEHAGSSVSTRTIERWIQYARDGREGIETIAKRDEEDVQRLAKLIIDAGIPTESIERISKVRVKSWGVAAKDEATQEIITKDLYSTDIVIEPLKPEGPKWPVVQPAAPIIIKYTSIPRASGKGIRTVVVIPDVQTGFLRDLDDLSRLDPIHDLAAIDIAMQIVHDLRPTSLGHIGDFLDLPEMSRWLQHEEFYRTTQPAIDAGYRILCDFESAAGAPSAREATFWIEGNHDRRLQEYILKNARASLGIRPAAETPEDWPSQSIARLLHFDKLGIEFCGAYPGSEKWITPRLVARHNPLKKHDYGASVIVGHTHHLRSDPYTVRTAEGMQTFWNYEIGCLCRVDDRVPKRRLMRTPVPSDRGHISGWVQGVCVITIDGDRHAVELVEIQSGHAFFRGRHYVSRALHEVTI